jgi:hypothetical protein
MSAGPYFDGLFEWPSEAAYEDRSVAVHAGLPYPTTGLPVPVWDTACAACGATGIYRSTARPLDRMLLCLCGAGPMNATLTTARANPASADNGE